MTESPSLRQLADQPTPQVQMPLTPHTVSPFPRSRRVMKIVLGILLAFLIVIIAGAYWLTQQQMKNSVVPVETAVPESNSVEVMDEMDGWKTFSGKMYKFQYPADYLVTEDETGANVKIRHSTGEFVSIYSIETLTYQNFFECSDSVKENCQISFQGKPLVEDIIVDGRSAKSFYFLGGGIDNDYRRVEVLREEGTQYHTGLNVFLGDMNLSSDIVVDKNKIFDQILSTFEFVEDSIDIISGQGQEFSYSPMGLNFIIPVDWEFNSFANVGFGPSLTTDSTIFSNDVEGKILTGAYITLSKNIDFEMVKQELDETASSENISINNSNGLKYKTTGYKTYSPQDDNVQEIVIVQSKQTSYQFVLTYNNTDSNKEHYLKVYNNWLQSINFGDIVGEIPVKL